MAVPLRVARVERRIGRTVAGVRLRAVGRGWIGRVRAYAGLLRSGQPAPPPRTVGRTGLLALLRQRLLRLLLGRGRLGRRQLGLRGPGLRGLGLLRDQAAGCGLRRKRHPLTERPHADGAPVRVVGLVLRRVGRAPGVRGVRGVLDGGRHRAGGHRTRRHGTRRHCAGVRRSRRAAVLGAAAGRLRDVGLLRDLAVPTVRRGLAVGRGGRQFAEPGLRGGLRLEPVLPAGPTALRVRGLRGGAVHRTVHRTVRGPARQAVRRTVHRTRQRYGSSWRGRVAAAGRQRVDGPPLGRFRLLLDLRQRAARPAPRRRNRLTHLRRRLGSGSLPGDAGEVRGRGGCRTAGQAGQTRSRRTRPEFGTGRQRGALRQDGTLRTRGRPLRNRRPRAVVRRLRRTQRTPAPGRLLLRSAGTAARTGREGDGGAGPRAGNVATTRLPRLSGPERAHRRGTGAVRARRTRPGTPDRVGRPRHDRHTGVVFTAVGRWNRVPVGLVRVPHVADRHLQHVRAAALPAGDLVRLQHTAVPFDDPAGDRQVHRAAAAVRAAHVDPYDVAALGRGDHDRRVAGRDRGVAGRCPRPRRPRSGGRAPGPAARRPPRPRSAARAPRTAPGPDRSARPRRRRPPR